MNAANNFTMTGLARLAVLLILLPAVMLGSASDGGQKAQGKDQKKSTQNPLPDGAKPEKPPEQIAELSDPSLSGIEQFELRAGNVNAESRQGRIQSLAEIVNPFTVRKRGRFYGSVYEYHRNDNFDARNFFDPVGEPLPEFKRNQFGASFGTFITSRLTVFGTYDGLRVNKGSTILSHVPTPAMKKGDYSGLDFQLVDPLTGIPFANNQIPVSKMHPVALKLLSRIPDPNRNDVDRNYVNNQPHVQNNSTITGRVDYELSNDSKLFANCAMSDGNEIRVNPLPAFGSTVRRRNQDFQVDYTRNFGSSLVTSLNLKFGRDAEQELSADAGKAGLLSSLGIAGIAALDKMDEGYPNFELEGYMTLGLGRTASPRTSFQNRGSIAGNLTWVRKAHQINVGGQIASIHLNNYRSGGKRRGEFAFNGDFSGDAFADLLLGMPNSAVRGVGSDRQDLRQLTWRAFIREEWKISSRFTLSASLAYNFNPFFRSARDNVSLFYPLLFEPPIDGEIVVTGSERASARGLAGLESGQAVYTNRQDWEPAVGLAYSPLGNKKLVIRSSYQIRRNPLDLHRVQDFVGKNYPFYYIERAESSVGTPEIDLARPFNALTPAEVTIRAIDPHNQNPHVQEWQLSVQNEIVRNWNLEINYEGRRVVHSSRALPSNIPLPGPGSIQPRRPNPAFGRFDILTDGASSIAHTMEIGMRKRFSRSFSLDSEFRWNRFHNDEFNDPANPRNLIAERSPSGWMPEKELRVNYIFDLPIGRGKAVSTEWAGKLHWLLDDWRISGITRIQQGRRFNPRMSGDTNNDGLSGERPDRIGSGWLDPSQRSIDRWFAIEDFAAPPQYGFGNSGRNILFSPGEHVWDVGFIKRAKITDSGNTIELRIQIFNALNHTNFDRPDSTFGTEIFGKIFSAKDAREIEIALKYSF